MWRRALLLLLWAMVVVSCAPPRASQGGFNSPDPASRMHAITRADHASIGYLIESLDSDDPAERMLAIQALQRITGERRGYDAHALPYQRRESIERWQAAYEDGRLDAGP